MVEIIKYMMIYYCEVILSPRYDHPRVRALTKKSIPRVRAFNKSPFRAYALLTSLTASWTTLRGERPFHPWTCSIGRVPANPWVQGEKDPIREVGSF